MFDDGSYIDVFDITSASQGLGNFATGELAKPAIQTSMFFCLGKGEIIIHSLITEWLKLGGNQGTPLKCL